MQTPAWTKSSRMCSGVLKKKDHKDNAAAHRVLGDALMRQGKLQEALNTYRRALNLL